MPCAYVDNATLEAATNLEYVLYRWLTWFYLIIGISTNVFILLAFYQQSKTEKAYGYQVVFTISKTLEIFAFGTYLLEEKWVGYSDGPEWFITSYFFMSYFLAGLGLHMSLIISSLLLSIAMAADRVFALLKPMVYRNINHLKHQIGATVACVFIGFLGGGIHFFDMEMIWTNAKHDYYFYSAYFDKNLEHTAVGQMNFYFRLLCRVGGVTLLIVLNIVMVIVFRKRMRKVGSMTKNQQSDDKRKSAEKTLFGWLNIYQAFLMLANQIPHTGWQVLLYMLPSTFEDCEGRFIGPFCDGMLMITDTVDFFIIISINPQMRKLVANVLPACCRDRILTESIPVAGRGTQQVQKQGRSPHS